MRTSSVTVRLFFESVILKVTWSRLCLKFVLNNYEPLRQHPFKRHPTVEDFTDRINIRAILSLAIIMKQKSTKVPEKLSVAQKFKPSLRRTLHQNKRWHFTYFYMLLLSPQQTYFLNSFHATDLFEYPQKTSENHRFSDVFRGYPKRSVAWNGLI